MLHAEPAATVRLIALQHTALVPCRLPGCLALLDIRAGCTFCHAVCRASCHAKLGFAPHLRLVCRRTACCRELPCFFAAHSASPSMLPPQQPGMYLWCRGCRVHPHRGWC